MGTIVNIKLWGNTLLSSIIRAKAGTSIFCNLSPYQKSYNLWPINWAERIADLMQYPQELDI